MSEARAIDWGEVVDSLHGVSNVMTVRSHYPAGHPAIERAGRIAAESFARTLAKSPEVIVALLDGELVVCERPMPELRDRLAALREAMVRRELECFVVQRGVTAVECATLGRFLASAPTDLQREREQTQAELAHVLLRYAELRKDDARRPLAHAEYFVTETRDVLDDVARSLASRSTLARERVTSLAERLVNAGHARTFRLEQRSVSDKDDMASHVTNVALMAVAMAIEVGHRDEVCVDLACAALLHDVGHWLLPAEIRATPEPMLDERQRAVFRNHTFAGARALFAVSCPALWVAAALEHHRGVDGRGYPELQAKDAPHPLVRIISLANYVDRKRTLLRGRVDAPDAVLRGAMALEGRYFDTATLHGYVRALGMYPPGTTVELSDRRAAMVTQANPSDPVRPYVEIILGEAAGKRFDLKTLDGAEDRHTLSIVRAIPPPIVPYDAAAVAEQVPVLEPIAVDVPPVSVPPVSMPPVVIAAKPRMSGLYRAMSRDDADDVPIPSAPPPAISLPPRATSTKPPEMTEAMILERLGSLERIPVPAVAPGELPKLSLDHRAGFVLTLVDGTTSLDMIADLSGLPRADALALLLSLLERGAIRLT